MFLFATPVKSLTNLAALSAFPVKAVNDFCALSKEFEREIASLVSLATWSIIAKMIVAFVSAPNASLTILAAKEPSLPIFLRLTPTAVPAFSSFFNPTSAFLSSLE